MTGRHVRDRRLPPAVGEVPGRILQHEASPTDVPYVPPSDPWSLTDPHAAVRDYLLDVAREQDAAAGP